jgi:hypothetical protein
MESVQGVVSPKSPDPLVFQATISLGVPEPNGRTTVTVQDMPLPKVTAFVPQLTVTVGMSLAVIVKVPWL